MLAGVISVWATPKIYGDFHEAELVDCYDGDTCKFNLPNVHPLLGANINVRLLGIDAPEIKTKCQEERHFGLSARDALRQLLHNASKISLKNTQRDKYFRILADIYADNLNVQRALLDRQLVVPYDGKKKAPQGKYWCQPAVRVQTSRIDL
jgi:micrococcal nuclease